MVLDVHQHVDALLTKVMRTRATIAEIRNRMRRYRQLFLLRKTKQKNIKNYLQALHTIKELKASIYGIKGESELTYYRNKLSLSPFLFGPSLIEDALIQWSTRHIDRGLPIRIQERRNLNMILSHCIRKHSLSSIAKGYVVLKKTVLYAEPSYIDEQCQELLRAYVECHRVSVEDYSKCCSILQSVQSSERLMSSIHEEKTRELEQELHSFCTALQLNDFDENWMKQLIRKIEDFEWVEASAKLLRRVVVRALRHLLDAVIGQHIQTDSQRNLMYIMSRFYHRWPSLHRLLDYRTIKFSRNGQVHVLSHNEHYGGLVLYLGQRLQAMRDVKGLWVRLVGASITSLKELEHINFLTEEISAAHEEELNVKSKLLSLRKLLEGKHQSEETLERGYSEFMAICFRHSDYVEMRALAKALRMEKEWAELIANAYEACE